MWTEIAEVPFFWIFCPHFSVSSSAVATKLRTVFPELSRSKNSRGRDDSTDQLRRRYIKPGIARPARWICHTHIFPRSFPIHSPRAQHFGLTPFLNGNVVPRLQIPIDCR